jgi:hypothetical protein
MSAHKGPASSKPRCTRGCSPVAAMSICQSANLPFHWSQYAVNPHFSIQNLHSIVQSALWLRRTFFCQTICCVVNSQLCSIPGSSWRGMGYSNLESGDPIRYRATVCRMGNNTYWGTARDQSLNVTLLTRLGAWGSEESNRVKGNVLAKIKYIIKINYNG